MTGNKRLTHGLQFNASYTWSHSIDDASRNNNGIVVPDSSNVASGKGSSDFDARQRFVINAIYDLPFKGNRFISGWEVAPIFSAQSGNPFDVVIPATTITGAGNTVTPIVVGPLTITNNPLGQWIAPASANPSNYTGIFANPVTQTTFGSFGRNAFVGPGFVDVDLALAKNTKITERLNMQLRVDAFDLLNHPNYGQPSRVLSALTGQAAQNFSTITNTRFPTGDSGSSRQLQFAAKFQF